MIPLNFDTLSVVNNLYPFGAPPAGAERFLLVDMASGGILADIPGDDRTFDLSTLSLPDGPIALGLIRQDIYGSLSTVGTASGNPSRGTITVEISGGDAVTQLIDPSALTAIPAADGMVSVSWRIADGTGQQTQPAAWEIARVDGAYTIIESGEIGRYVRIDKTLGPFSDGETVCLAVRHSDGIVDGARGPWITFTPVVVDAAAPPIPEIVV